MVSSVFHCDLADIASRARSVARMIDDASAPKKSGFRTNKLKKEFFDNCNSPDRVSELLFHLIVAFYSKHYTLIRKENKKMNILQS